MAWESPGVSGDVFSDVCHHLLTVALHTKSSRLSSLSTDGSSTQQNCCLLLSHSSLRQGAGVKPGLTSCASFLSRPVALGWVLMNSYKELCYVFHPVGTGFTITAGLGMAFLLLPF